ncbi:response regulator [Pseudomonas violetae]|jgi:CheY-like chemotaxis protein|uniref:Response regulator n=1 Tax=Pseudomonas violetae TaxID=2915813 RepID=A0ABT0F3C5_9PSED|nr:response regulator [Pseudomonas violetae]MCK1792206.1 response regulator [Pseudomonas violetae]
MNEADLRILLVEDHCFQLRATQILLERYGFGQITTADSAEVALQKMRETAQPYDVLLCDQCLPDLCGLQLIEAATNLGMIKHAVLLSSLTSVELDRLVKLATRQGLPLLGYLIKPPKHLELITLLTSAK